MLKVAAGFGVSSSYMARICNQLNVPRPERGYWAKLAVGKAPEPPGLPDSRPGDQLEWSRDSSQSKRARRLPKPPGKTSHKRHVPKGTPPDRHPLVVGAKSLFETGRLSRYGNYLKPAKKLLVDLQVTSSSLGGALSFANELFVVLEARGHRVVIAPTSEQFCRADVDERENPAGAANHNDLWSPMRCTVAYLGTVAIGLTVIETSEEAQARYIDGELVRTTDFAAKRRGRRGFDHGWTTTRQFPTGRLSLQAYSPYPCAEWTKQWRETKSRSLSGRIPTIVKELEQATVEIARLVEEGERQAEIDRHRWEAQRERWRREEAARQAEKARTESTDELLEIIDDWAAARRLEEFFADAERRAQDLPLEQREMTIERLRQARSLIGTTDALERFGVWRAPEER